MCDWLRDELRNIYLQRYAWPGPVISAAPDINTQLIVVIPCYNEPDILDSLSALYHCDAPGCHVEIIVVVNHADNENQEIKDFNQNTLLSIENWINKMPKKDDRTFYTIRAFDLPAKQAGVGLARKIGMDEAIRRFSKMGNENGTIVCFDADCLCTPNYLFEIHEFYTKKPDAISAQVFFEHPLEGKLNSDVYDAIVNYELHLRYYKNAMHFVGFPFDFHTVGSCITVRSEAYQKQGGMNRRKAGEDFYFLQKIVQLGAIGSINNATVFPSPRPSNRVPFGTGKAINAMLHNQTDAYFTYNTKSFVAFKDFVLKVTDFYNQPEIKSIINALPDSIRGYCMHIQFELQLAKIRKNCRTKSQFLKSFYNWFNGFLALKYVHFARERYHEDVEILDAANWILKELSPNHHPTNSKRVALQRLRDLDRLG